MHYKFKCESRADNNFSSVIMQGMRKSYDCHNRFFDSRGLEEKGGIENGLKQV